MSQVIKKQHFKRIMDIAEQHYPGVTGELNLPVKITGSPKEKEFMYFVLGGAYFSLWLTGDWDEIARMGNFELDSAIVAAYNDILYSMQKSGMAKLKNIKFDRNGNPL